MVGFTIIALIGATAIWYWKIKGFDLWGVYTVYTICIVALSYFIFSPQCLGDIIK